MDTEDILFKEMVEQGKLGRPGGVRVDTYDKLDPERGMTRVTGSKADKEVRDLVVDLMKKANLKVSIDAAGNIFGKLSGKGKAILVGSHVDSVVNGGQFDGALGVFTAIEAVRRLQEEDFRHRRPIEIVVYSGEEGSSFKYGLLGSSVLTGKLSIEEAYEVRNREGLRYGDSLNTIQYKGKGLKNLDDYEYALELHIEQGPILEQKEYDIGIVENITGLTWMHGEIEGAQGHAGTTPMAMRKNALVAASKLIDFADRTAKDTGPTTVATIGELYTFPNMPNVIPGEVVFELDARDVIESNMKHVESAMMEYAQKLESDMGV